MPFSNSLTDRELRALVRDAIARHVGPSTGSGENLIAEQSAQSLRAHASHGRLPVLRGADGDGACLIEPTVRCNHCGYCQSYGH